MSTSGGSTWREIDNIMDNGNSIALGSIYQGGCWDHDADAATASVPAVFKSTDDGATWQRKALSAAAGEIVTLETNPSDKNILYAGGYATNAEGRRTAVLLKTTHGGNDWNSVNFPTPAGVSSDIMDILIDPNSTSRILVATRMGVYTTTNGGTDWRNPSVSTVVTCLAADARTAGKLYAGTQGAGVYATTNGGTDWSQMNTGLTCKYIRCLEMDPV